MTLEDILNQIGFVTVSNNIIQCDMQYNDSQKVIIIQDDSQRFLVKDIKVFNDVIVLNIDEKSI